MKVSNTFRVGKFICEMRYTPGAGLSAEWTPVIPRRGELSRSEVGQYRAGRDALVAEIAKAIGGNVLLVE